MRIRLGDWDVGSDAELYPFIERFVTEVYVHPYFYAGNLQNDVAILRMDRPVDFNFNTHIAPVCLPPRFESFAGKRCLVTGWGKDAWGLQGSYSHILKKVDLPVLTNFDCQEKLRFTRLGPNFNLNPGFMCAGGEPGKDACKVSFWHDCLLCFCFFCCLTILLVLLFTDLFEMSMLQWSSSYRVMEAVLSFVSLKANMFSLESSLGVSDADFPVCLECTCE